MNLKDFGKGRLVTRNAITAKFPEVPSFFRIVSVHPHMMQYKEADFRGNIFVEEIFCGRKRSAIIDIGADLAGNADFRLVHKSEEGELLRKVEQFLANPENHKPVIRPRTTPLPPVWREIIAREKKISPEEVPEIPIIYQDETPEIFRPTRLAEDGEKPDFQLGPKHVQPIHEEFYEHVIFNKEAAREKYCNGPPPEPDFIYARKTLPPLELEKKSKQSSAAINN